MQQINCVLLSKFLNTAERSQGLATKLIYQNRSLGFKIVLRFQDVIRWCWGRWTKRRKILLCNIHILHDETSSGGFGPAGAVLELGFNIIMKGTLWSSASSCDSQGLMQGHYCQHHWLSEHMKRKAFEGHPRIISVRDTSSERFWLSVSVLKYAQTLCWNSMELGNYWFSSKRKMASETTGSIRTINLIWSL